MRYSTEPKYRKYVQDYGVLYFATKFEDKYGNTLMDTATKTVIDAANLLLKEYFEKLQKLQEI